VNAAFEKFSPREHVRLLDALRAVVDLGDLWKDRVDEAIIEGAGLDRILSKAIPSKPRRLTTLSWLKRFPFCPSKVQIVPESERETEGNGAVTPTGSEILGRLSDYALRKIFFAGDELLVDIPWELLMRKDSRFVQIKLQMKEQLQMEKQQMEEQRSGGDVVSKYWGVRVQMGHPNKYIEEAM